MPSRRKSLIVAALLALLMTIGPPVYRTAPYVDSAGELMLLASISKDDYSLNPWSQDCYVLGPNQAAFILEKFDWPYENGPEQSGFVGVPLFHMALTRIGPLSNPTTREEFEARMLPLMRTFLQRGISPETRHDGLTVLHSAILSGSLDAVKILVDGGADVKATIERPGRGVDKLDSLEWATLLNSKSPSTYGPILDYLEIETSATN